MVGALTQLAGSIGGAGDRALAAAETACTLVPSYAGGVVVDRVCAERPGPSHTVLDLRDEWAPLIFSEVVGHPQPYRATFLDLANERLGPSGHLSSARRDRYYELYGIFPSIGVVRTRLADAARHTCHAAIDDQPLRARSRTLSPQARPAPFTLTAARSGALGVVQAHLTCDGYLAPSPEAGTFDARTQAALALYQRRHMVPSRPVVDHETREVLLTPSRELDFRALLRALRERVVDASGLIEDGSAGSTWEPILGRFIDSGEYRQQLRSLPVAGAAPDLVDRATEAAAVALGWTSPEAAMLAISAGAPGLVAVRLPQQPAYASRVLDMRAEIDRGDVWRSYPLDAEGRPRRSPVKNRPTLTLFARTPEGDIALVRWPTTIGAWKEEKVDEDTVELRYKASPVGRAYWRDVVAAPAWFPPLSTPDRELVHRTEGGWAPDKDAVGPGYRSAYGLVALLHHRGLVTAGGGEALSDLEIRTHGSGNYRSIMRGSSHGCHRLFNHLAIRLGSYLLAHHEHQRWGEIAESYARTLHWKGHSLKLRVAGRGYRYELQPPIVVDVLPGRRVGARPRPVEPPKASSSPTARHGVLVANPPDS